MVLQNPQRVRLVPGESSHALFSLEPSKLARVGFFIRPSGSMAVASTGFQVSHRAGLIRFDDVLLVVTMIRLSGDEGEIFDIWWNYHAADGPEEFERMAEQERLPIHIYTNRPEPSLLEIENSFRKFFKYSTAIFGKTKSWSHVAFDRAIRGFCAQSYPKEKLWDTMEFKAVSGLPEQDRSGTIETYPGIIPDELQSYYAYSPDQGHCIKIIPSMLEHDAERGNPDEYLHAAPVRTVLRCGIRWVRGHPVAPIPFIPGYGLAVPPDDIEY
jgi:hypothetical protein